MDYYLGWLKCWRDSNIDEVHIPINKEYYLTKLLGSQMLDFNSKLGREVFDDARKSVGCVFFADS
jgi:hypothetical protein